MRLKRPPPTLAFPLLCALSLAACRHASPQIDSAGQAMVGPMNVRERMAAEQWAKATKGLDFETSSGLVGVQCIGNGDAAAAAERLAEGHALLEANRILDALEQYGLAARHDPDLADAYVGIGRAVKRKGKLEQAIASFRTALDRDEDHLEARFQLAMSLWSAARRDEAIVQMNAAVAADDTFGKAHERLAVWHYFTGDYAAAWLHLHRAEALGRRVPAQLASLLGQRMPDPDAGR